MKTNFGFNKFWVVTLVIVVGIPLRVLAGAGTMDGAISYVSASDYPEYTLGVEGYIASSDLVARGVVTAQHATIDGPDGPATIEYDVDVFDTLYQSERFAVAGGRQNVVLGVPAHRKAGHVLADYAVGVGQEYLFFLRSHAPNDPLLYAHRGVFGRVPRGASILAQHELFGGKSFDDIIWECRQLAASVQRVGMSNQRIPTGKAKARVHGAAVVGRRAFGNDLPPAASQAEALVVLPSLPRGNWRARSALLVGGKGFYVYDWMGSELNEGEVIFPVSSKPAAEANALLFKGD